MTRSDATTGMQLAHLGRYSEALPWLDRANCDAPADVSVLNALGNLLMLDGRATEAHERYRVAAPQLPNDLRLWCGWARISVMTGLREQALDQFGHALRIDPRCGNLGGWLEGILREVADADTACEVLAVLCERHPQHAGLCGLLAVMLLEDERLQEAQAAFERYQGMRVGNAWARVNLGGLAAGRGDVEVAREHFRAVLAREPRNSDALWGLAELNDWRLDDALHAAVKHAVACKPDMRALARLHETLAKHHDRAGEYPAAWRHAARTNAMTIEIAAPELRYSAPQHVARIDSLINHYTAPLLESLRGAGSTDPRPVFIVGLPRSGTTLLERMLAAHPQIVGVGEQPFAEAGWKRALAGSEGVHDTNVPTAIGQAAAWHLHALERRAHHLGLDADASRIVDKLPDNYMMAGWLRLAFPNAAIIHVQRDPRDVAISCWFAQFVNVQWINELRHIAHRIEQHRRLLRHWRTTLGAHLTEVRYEDLIADPESELRRVLAALRIDWHPDVVSHAGRQGHVGSASRQQVREPVHTRSLERWRNYAAAMEPILARLDVVATQDAIDVAACQPAEPEAVPAGRFR
jgi:tetratricopeptide (TPR) repeat protein